jgi:hypothetical protein
MKIGLLIKDIKLKLMTALGNTLFMNKEKAMGKDIFMYNNGFKKGNGLYNWSGAGIRKYYRVSSTSGLNNSSSAIFY